MKRHFKQVHMRVRNISCPVCGKKFFEASVRNNHMAKLHPNMTLKCHICTRPYAYVQDLMQHLHRKHRLGVEELQNLGIIAPGDVAQAATHEAEKMHEQLATKRQAAKDDDSDDMML